MTKHPAVVDEVRGNLQSVANISSSCSGNLHNCASYDGGIDGERGWTVSEAPSSKRCFLGRQNLRSREKDEENADKCDVAYVIAFNSSQTAEGK